MPFFPGILVMAPLLMLHFLIFAYLAAKFENETKAVKLKNN
jgi:hypothetical protein